MTGSRLRRAGQHLAAPVVRSRAAVARWLHPASALIIPTLEAGPAVAGWTGRRRIDFDGAPLHVTVMYPFLPAPQLDGQVEDQVRDIAAGTPGFSFSLAHVDQFPGVYYLAPSPADPFVTLTELVQEHWPQCQPYGGMFDQITPHVTVAFGETPPADPALLQQRLPIACVATELWLIEQKAAGWRTRKRFPLRATASTQSDEADQIRRR
ncbi:MAG: 2'-5' RNA ligase family protein [Streptosporangiaceae bacterium]